MREQKVTQDNIEQEGIAARSTFQRFLNGQAELDDRRFALLVARVGVTADQIIHGEQAVGPDVVEVPIFDVQVAAGVGRVPLDEAQAIGSWPFPAEWVAASFGGNAELKLLRVAGDSQEPELRDGDMVMINTRNPQVREGMQVVRLDDALLIKRLQLQGATVRLRSANPAYSDIIVERDQIESDGFAVIGRAVWAGKLL